MLRHRTTILATQFVRQASSGAKKTLKQLAAEGNLSSGQTVLVRADLNVPFSKTEPGVITDDTRLRGVIPTLDFLREMGTRVVIATHCGRPKGKVAPEFSVQPIGEALSGLINSSVKVTSDCIGSEAKETVQNMNDGELVLLENVRFHKGETDNDSEFAAALAETSGAQVFVNDAFGTAHRAHASTTGVVKHMEHAVAGFLVSKELEYIEKAVLQSPRRPLVAILGGAKVSTKIPVIKSLMERCDTIILGVGMCGTFFKALGHNVGDTIMEPDYMDMAKQFLEHAQKNNVKLYLPKDAVIADQFSADANHKVSAVDQIPDGWRMMDFGPESNAEITTMLEEAQTVLWNGPPGVFEFDAFAKGTNEIAHTLARLTEQGTITVVGGGDTAAAVSKAGVADKVSHVSTGGGASLEMLEGQTLPGIAALDDA